MEVFNVDKLYSLHNLVSFEGWYMIIFAAITLFVLFWVELKYIIFLL